MIKFRRDFNCCKTVGCSNFGVVDSEDYIYKSRSLGYLSIKCLRCGSNPPWVNNALIKSVLEEKIESQFGRKLTGCPKCYKYYFITDSTDAKSYGFTSAGTQRKKCTLCNCVFTLQNYKNIESIKSVLAAVIENKDTASAIKSTGLSARLYYFYLDKLALILSNFSRLNEERVIPRTYLPLYTQGFLLNLEHKRGFYTFITSELESGYILLQSNNLTSLPLSSKNIYNTHENTTIVTKDFANIENVLIDRYQQNMLRKHFEQLLVGELRPITKCNLIYPDKLAYIHFQLLNAFTSKATQYGHLIEHESCLRAAALMAADTDIKKSNAGVYFFVPFEPGKEELQGKPIGWWKDKWYSNRLGAYSPITAIVKNSSDVELPESGSVGPYYSYLNQHMNKGINSMSVIDNLSEIHRVIFNYCELKKQKTRANLLGVTDEIYNPESLLDEALKVVMED